MVFGLCVLLGPTVARGDGNGAEVTLANPETNGTGAPMPFPPPTSPLGPDGAPLPMDDVPSDRALETANTSEAASLAEERVEEAFPAIAEDPLRTFDASEVTKFINDNVARVNPPGPEPVELIASYAPLRDESDDGSTAPVDLDLQREGGHFEAQNPLTDVSLPDDLSSPLRLQRSGVGLSLLSPEATDSSATQRKDATLFYHEAAKDTDLILTPVTRGVELMAQIRSADAPEGLEFAVSLPGGMELRDAGQEGVEVVSSGQRVALISSPIAVDANGDPVASHLVVGPNNTVTLTTAHRATDAYPVLVDPAVSEDWSTVSWQSNNNSNSVGWFRGSYIPNGQYSAPVTSPTNGNPANGCVSGYSCWQGGLYVYAGANWQILSGAVGQWIYQPSGNSSYITQTSLSPINFSRNGENSWVTPHAYYGVYSTDAPGWVNSQTKGDNYAPNPTSYSWTRPSNGALPADPDEVVFGMGSSYNRIGTNKLTANRTTALGGATISVSDGENGRVTAVTHSPALPANWTDAYSGAATVTAWDGDAQNYGLGVYKIKVGTPTASGGTTWTEQLAPPAPNYKDACSGTRSNPCPTSLSKTFSYNTTQFPEGVNTVTAQGIDILGKSQSSPADSWQIKVDRTDPSVPDVSGAITSGAEPLTEANEVFTASATDAVSGVTSLTARIDAQDLSSVSAACSGDGCLGKQFTIPTDSFSDGVHTVTVEARDAAGHQRQASFQVEIDRDGDIYHATQYNGDPEAGGSTIQEEWVKLGTTTARVVRDTAIDGALVEDAPGGVTRRIVQTRDVVPCGPPTTGVAECGEVRSVSTNTVSPTDSRVSEASVFQGSAPSDQNLQQISGLIDSVTEADGVPESTGPLASVLATWQKPPPAHGAQYGRYDVSVDSEALGRRWVDESTGLPLKQAVIDSATGLVLDEVYWTYEPRRHLREEYSATFFRTEPIGEPELEQNVTYRSDLPVGSQTDVETGSSFDPMYLGADAQLTLQNNAPPTPLCLDSTDLVRFDAQPEGQDPDADDPELATDPAAPQTFVAANYEVVSSGEVCNSGSGTGGRPAFDVISLSADSSYAQQVMASQVPTAQELEQMTGEADMPAAGTEEVEVNGIQTTAFMVPVEDNEAQTAISLGETVVLVRGPIDELMAPLVMEELSEGG